MKSNVKYYDFWVGTPNENPKEWKYQGLKIAAVSPEMAVYAKQLLYTGSKHKRNRIFNLGKDDNNKMYLAFMSIRMIVEFELTKRTGKTKYQFKKISEYRITKSLNIT